MTSEIGIGTYLTDGKPIVEMRHLRVTNIAAPYTGVSERTGEPFKIIKVNLELNIGENTKRNYIMATAFTQVANRIESEQIKVNDVVSIQVDFNIAGRFPNTEVRLVSITKEQ